MNDEFDDPSPQEAVQPNPMETQTPVNLNEVMVNDMAKLERRNQELGGRMLTAFGAGDHKLLLFREPGQRPATSEEQQQASWAETSTQYLFVTPEGYKTLEFITGVGGSRDLANDLAKAHQSPNSFIDNAGYHEERGDKPVRYLNLGRQTFAARPDGLLVGHNSGVAKLVDHPMSEQVTEIIRNNVEVAKQKHTEEMATKEAERQRLDAQLAVSQKLDDLLA